MGTIDFTALKLKLLSSIVAILRSPAPEAVHGSIKKRRTGSCCGRSSSTSCFVTSSVLLALLGSHLRGRRKEVRGFPPRPQHRYRRRGPSGQGARGIARRIELVIRHVWRRFSISFRSRRACASWVGNNDGNRQWPALCDGARNVAALLSPYGHCRVFRFGKSSRGFENKSIFIEKRRPKVRPAHLSPAKDRRRA